MTLLSLAQSPLPKSPPAVSETTFCDWSKLPLDLIQLVFERLGYLDFKRAKLVCSSWHSGSKQSRRPNNNKIPWMILFVVEENYCLLFNPEDKEKFYKSRHLGDNLSNSFCLTTYRSWLLMQNSEKDLVHESYGMYIVDTLTSERINLPAIASDDELSFPILWIDEKIKDYLVIGMAIIYDGKEYKGTLVSLKKGNNSWKRIPQLQQLSCDKNFNMVYKDRKLYCLDYSDLHIFDFSGEYPLQIFRISIHGYVFDKNSAKFSRIRLTIPMEYQMDQWKNNVIVTVQGDVLIVVSKRGICSYTWEFKIYKMMDSLSKQWEEIVSLGDESILLDLGVTVLAKDFEGIIISNSIYFTSNDLANEYEENKIFIFHLDTKKVEYPLPFMYSSIPISHAHWFLPSFKRKYD